MKYIISALCVLLFTLTIYVIQKGFRVPETRLTPQNTVQHSGKDTADVTDNTILKKKNCACCDKKLTPAQERAKQRQQARETWGRLMIAKHGYEEGMRRITVKSPVFAKQMQRILDREKRLGHPFPVSSSETQ
ncbi:MAG: hypothetical protein OXG97_20310 [Candidatus Poribacteria bacterium]|nr:hypothetical protein [Candidatus Poribacteria bacterium]